MMGKAGVGRGLFRGTISCARSGRDHEDDVSVDLLGMYKNFKFESTKDANNPSALHCPRRMRLRFSPTRYLVMLLWLTPLNSSVICNWDMAFGTNMRWIEQPRNVRSKKFLSLKKKQPRNASLLYLRASIREENQESFARSFPVKVQAENSSFPHLNCSLWLGMI